VGGIKSAYLACLSDISGYTASNGEITGITMVGGAQFKQYEFKPNTSSFTETPTISRENGPTFISQTVNLLVPKRELAKRNEIALLLQGQPQLVAIIEDSNGEIWLFGKEEGVYVSEATTGSGVAKGDANNYNITFLGEEPELAYKVTSAALSAVS
jgi:hypothetical protein